MKDDTTFTQAAQETAQGLAMGALFLAFPPLGIVIFTLYTINYFRKNK